MEAALLLSRAFLESHPADAARVLEAQTPAASAAILADSPVGAAAAVVQQMVPGCAADSLAALPAAVAAAITAELPVDTAADLLRRLGREAQTALVASLPDETSDAVDRLLRYPEGTAGAMMDPQIFALPDDITVSQARRRVRHSSQHLRYYLYVVDRRLKLVGVISLRDFMVAAGKEPIGSIMRSGVYSVLATASLREVIGDPGSHRYQALPVVDEQGVLLGVLGGDVLRRLQFEMSIDRLPQKGPWETLLAIGELYWAGLGGLLSGFMPAPPRPSLKGPPPASKGGPHGR